MHQKHEGVSKPKMGDEVGLPTKFEVDSSGRSKKKDFLALIVGSVVMLGGITTGVLAAVDPKLFSSSSGAETNTKSGQRVVACSQGLLLPVIQKYIKRNVTHSPTANTTSSQRVVACSQGLLLPVIQKYLDRCTRELPCDEGEGHCEWDNECRDALVCQAGDPYDDVDEVCVKREDRCSPEKPCPLGMGDCDEDVDCTEGLVCQKGDGDDEVCVRPEDRCSAGKPCPLHLGDCDDDAGCQGGLVCQKGDGDDEVCVRPEDRCSAEKPCPLNIGDCDDDAGCQGSLVCQMDDAGDEVCVRPEDRCSAEKPCPLNVGDCDDDAGCQGSLVCQKGDGDDGVCVRPEDRCTPQKPCDVGVEGCNANNDCRGDLVCGSNTCTSVSSFLNRAVFIGIQGCGGLNVNDLHNAIMDPSLAGTFGGFGYSKTFEWRSTAPLEDWNIDCAESAYLSGDWDKVKNFIDNEVESKIGGPISLLVIGGHSLGGWVALEVARRVQRKADMIITLDPVFSSSKARRPVDPIQFHKDWGCGINWYQGESALCQGCNPACNVLDICYPVLGVACDVNWLGQKAFQGGIKDEQVRFFYRSDCSRHECHCNCAFCSWGCYTESFTGIRICRHHGFSCQQCGQSCAHGRYTHHMDISRDPCIMKKAVNNVKSAVARALWNNGMTEAAESIDPLVATRSEICHDYEID